LKTPMKWTTYLVSKIHNYFNKYNKKWANLQFSKSSNELKTKTNWFLVILKYWKREKHLAAFGFDYIISQILKSSNFYERSFYILE